MSTPTLLPMFSEDDDLFSSSSSVAATVSRLQSLAFSLSILRDKIRSVQSMLSSLVAAGQPTDAAVEIHEMIAEASSVLFDLQQLAFVPPAAAALRPGLDVVELDVGELLAQYRHRCRVCGKGFRRDANLRMHMRAHGDEYKTREALARAGGGAVETKKYSCPQDGCRWNWRHHKFHPLKSVTCAKNHYKRCHFPKLYVCGRCRSKEFSVVSDLRAHEKHCGNPRWRCSCGTTFSRKDKLMGHVALFVGGHVPAPEGAAIDQREAGRLLV